MSKLIPMEAAAKILGMSVEKLNELRTNNEVFGYRDGSTWKFKMSELERVADDLGLSVGSVEAPSLDSLTGGSKSDSEELDLGLEDSSQDMFLEPDSDSIAMQDSSIELFSTPLGGKDGGTSSDIFSDGDLSDDDEGDLIDLAKSGLLVKGGSKKSLLDNDEDSGELSLADAPDELSLADSGEFKLEDSGELSLADSGELNLDDSDKLDVGKSPKKKAENSGELKLEDSGELSLKDSGELELDDVGSFDLADSSVFDGAEDDDDLSFGSSSLELASEKNKSDSPSATGSDILSGEEQKSDAPSTGKLGGGEGDLSLEADDDLFDDELDLADSASFESSEVSSAFEESADFVLDDSDSSAELTLEANESGIALSANESGIALGDEPLELGGSDIDELELPEDDDIILVEDSADPDSQTLMEDDFNLTPHEMSLDDEEDSSGSQVIALAESEIYTDDSAATMLGGDSFSDPSAEGGDFYDPATAGMVAAGGAAAAGAGYAGAGMVPEQTYSKFEIGILALAALVLFLGTIVAYGTAQNLWLPDDQVVKSGLMNWFVEVLGLN